jgi:hypothetical protein
MNTPGKSAIAAMGLTSVLGVAFGIPSVHALPSSSADTLTPSTTTQCTRMPLSERGTCKDVVSLKERDSAALAQPRAAVPASARPSGGWTVSQAVDAQFASTFRSSVLACGGPFQIQLVDAPPQHHIRFRCLPR